MDAGGKCEWCGNVHATKCPMVKAIEYHPDGSTKRVEFYTPGDHGPVLAPAPVFAPLQPTWPHNVWMAGSGGLTPVRIDN